MQALGNTTKLKDYLCSDLCKEQVNPDVRTEGKVVREVALVVKALWCSNKKFIAAKDLKVRFLVVFKQNFKLHDLFSEWSDNSVTNSKALSSKMPMNC